MKRALEHQLKQLKEKLAQSAAGALETQARTLNGSRGAGRAARRNGPPADALAGRFAAQQVEVRGGRAGLLARKATSPLWPLSPKGPHRQGGRPASWWARSRKRSAAKGGGSPDMAEGGGKDAGAVDAALEKRYRDLEKAN